ncbi:MAG: hypothetical protein K0Q78_2932, partial [Cellvibrio sp.]|nr:hypothetical protein [Cellvibrio sp.]
VTANSWPLSTHLMNIFFRFLSCIILTSAFTSNLALAEPEGVNLKPMPADLEMDFALSALPDALRADASVYLLDPKQGYKLARKGKSTLECLVERTVWEWAQYRDDIYIPLCYDAN